MRVSWTGGIAGFMCLCKGMGDNDSGGAADDIAGRVLTSIECAHRRRHVGRWSYAYRRGVRRAVKAVHGGSGASAVYSRRQSIGWAAVYKLTLQKYIHFTLSFAVRRGSGLPFRASARYMWFVGPQQRPHRERVVPATMYIAGS